MARMTIMIFSLAFVTLLTIESVAVVAQTVPVSNRGLYLVNFMNKADQSNAEVRQQLYVSSSSDVETRISIPAAGVDEIVSLDSTNDRTFQATYDEDLGVPNNQQISQSAGLVVSQDGVKLFVHANRNEQGSSAAYMAFPLTNNSTSFFIPSYPSKSGGHTAFAVAGLQDGTCLEVYYVKGDNYKRKGLYHLDAYDVYQEINSTATVDFTGIFVNSTRPISVWGMNTDAYIPTNKNFGDAILTQVPPLHEWGTVFIIGNIAGRSRVQAGYEFRVIASENDTEVTYKPSGSAVMTETIERGEFVSGVVPRTTSTVYVTCSFKCLVVQYNRGRDTVSGEQTNTDPYMVLITPLDHYDSNVRFTTMEYFHQNGLIDANDYITVVAKTTATSGMRLDGQAMTDWSPVDGRTDYSSASVELATKGYHRLTNTDPAEEFTGWAYGHGERNTDKIGYGYVIAYKITDAPLDIPGIYDIQQTTTTDAPTTAVPWVIGPWSEDILPADLPQYGIRFSGVFRTITRHDNIIETSCTDGYSTFFKNKRLPAMASHMTTVVPTLCPGMDEAYINLTSHSQDLFYWEYTQGKFGFVMVLVGAPAASFREIAACTNNLKDYVKELNNWPSVSVFVGRGPEERLTKTSVSNYLSKDGDMESCNDVIVSLTDEGNAFQEQTKGWICNGLDPEEILTTIGGSTRPMSTPAILLTIFVLYLKELWV